MGIRWRTVVRAVLALTALASVPALANHIDTADVAATCKDYTLTVAGTDLQASHKYDVAYKIKLTPSSGSPTSLSGTVPVSSSDSQGDFHATVTEPLGSLNGDYTLSGTATLVDLTAKADRNTIAIHFSPSTLSCHCPQCVQQSQNTQNYNGTKIRQGSWVWHNANFTASGVPSTGATITFTNQTITVTFAGSAHVLPVPDSRIIFSPTAKCSSTAFNYSKNLWTTIVPVNGDDEIFLSGLANPVPVDITNQKNPVVWQGTFSTDTSGISMKWKTGAAVYSQLTSDYNELAVKSTHHNTCADVNGGDHAGTPEGVDSHGVPWKKHVIGGAAGGGGSNFTGSWSGTVSVKPVCTGKGSGGGGGGGGPGPG